MAPMEDNLNRTLANLRKQAIKTKVANEDNLVADKGPRIFSELSNKSMWHKPMALYSLRLLKMETMSKMHFSLTMVRQQLWQARNHLTQWQLIRTLVSKACLSTYHRIRTLFVLKAAKAATIMPTQTQTIPTTSHLHKMLVQQHFHQSLQQPINKTNSHIKAACLPKHQVKQHKPFLIKLNQLENLEPIAK